MAEQLGFKESFRGFDKTEVTQYLARLSKDIENKLLAKDTEITELKKENESLKNLIKSTSEQIEQINQEKSKIAEAILRAEESAKRIISEAEAVAARKIEQYNMLFAKEEQRLKSIVGDVDDLKHKISDILKGFDNQLDAFIDEAEQLKFEQNVQNEQQETVEVI